MATPLSIRLPLRAIVRSPAANSSTSLLRTPCSTLPAQNRHTRSYGSKSDDPPFRRERHKQKVYRDYALGRPGTPEFAAPHDRPGTAAGVESEANRELAKDVRLPRAVQAAYLRPLRRTAEYGVPSCDLQMRSYSVRNLEFFADFAMRAAYYLGLPAYGPVPLPRIVERWTVPKGSFIHKKSQENFERKTLRRLVQVKDGEADTVQIWLAFLRKHAYYGIGMKANVWEFSKLGKFFKVLRRRSLGDRHQANEKIDVGKQMDLDMEEMRGDMEETLGSFAMKRKADVQNKIIDLINRGDFRANSGGSAGMMPTNYMNEQNQ